ncbi:MAG: SDR family oxidoreductase [Polyangia bacterium]
MILGSTGTLGHAFIRLCDARGIPYHALGRKLLDLGNPTAIDDILAETNPWAIVNAAGYVRVDDAEDDPETCRRINAWSPIRIAAACAREGIPLLAFSSDLVFDGRSREPYTENSPVAPLNVYGLSKAEMERGVLAAMPDALVIRTSSFFGPWDEANFVTRALQTLSSGGVVRAACDQVVSPTYVPDLVHAALDLLVDGESGVWHLANDGALTWSDLASAAADYAGVRDGRVEPRPTRDLGLRARRPRNSALGSQRGWLMPSLEDALGRYLVERETT